MRPPGAAMVAEVTSSQPELDRRAKRRAHAAARIPLYLLIDRDEKRVLLFSGPARDEYVSTSPVPFGNSLELPAPFSFTLEADGLAT